jgi:hypothetical protein
MVESAENGSASTRRNTVAMSALGRLRAQYNWDSRSKTHVWSRAVKCAHLHHRSQMPFIERNDWTFAKHVPPNRSLNSVYATF